VTLNCLFLNQYRSARTTPTTLQNMFGAFVNAEGNLQKIVRCNILQN